MTITIGTITFDQVDYDADGDVLYLSVGAPREPADSYGTPEGHNVRYDENGRSSRSPSSTRSGCSIATASCA